MWCSGQVVLTTGSVTFQPNAMRVRLGIKPWSIPNTSIKKTEMHGSVAVFLVEGVDDPRRISGTGARIVQERLAAMLSDGAGGRFAPDERVLLHAAATVEINPLLHAIGEVTVTTHRVRFRANRVDRLVWPDVEFEHPSSEITGIDVCGIRPGIEVRTATRQTRFVGDVLPAMYAALRRNVEMAAGTAGGAGLDLKVWPGVLHRGPLYHAGALVHTAERLAFVATGLFDSLAGTPTVTEIALADITGMARRGRFEHRIEVDTATERMTVGTKDVDGSFNQLVAWLARGAPGPVRLSSEPPTASIAEVNELLVPWRPRVTLPDHPKRFMPAVCLTGSIVATVGWIVVSDDAMIWLPGRTPEEGAQPLTLPLARAKFVWTPNSDEVRVDVAGEPYRWVTARQREFKAMMFADVERAREIADRANAGNRRRSFRVDLFDPSSSPITVQIQCSGSEEPLDCRIANISAGGCSLRLVRPVDPATRLRVGLSESPRIPQVGGKLANYRDAGGGSGWVGGIAFDGTSPQFDTAIWEVCMKLQRDQLRRLSGNGNGCPPSAGGYTATRPVGDRSPARLPW